MSLWKRKNDGGLEETERAGQKEQIKLVARNVNQERNESERELGVSKQIVMRNKEGSKEWI